MTIQHVNDSGFVLKNFAEGTDQVSEPATAVPPSGKTPPEPTGTVLDFFTKHDLNPLLNDSSGNGNKDTREDEEQEEPQDAAIDADETSNAWPDATRPIPVDAGLAQSMPTAGAKELAALDICLSDPLNRQLIAEYGRGATALTAISAVAKHLVKRYGADRYIRIVCLHNALEHMRSVYADAILPLLDIARDMDAVHAGTPDRLPDPSAFDLGKFGAAFTAQYCRQDNLLAQAFAAICGTATSVERCTEGGEDVTAEEQQLQFCGGLLTLDPVSHGRVRTHRAAARLGSALITIFGNLNTCDRNDVADPGFFWFDPQLGVVTVPQNVRARQAGTDADQEASDVKSNELYGALMLDGILNDVFGGGAYQDEKPKPMPLSVIDAKLNAKALAGQLMIAEASALKLAARVAAI